ncbi:MAG: hypothetical protein RBR71_03215 [Gudongella sp.]|nr:hypothetical protein [Gudongella sp.]
MKNRNYLFLFLLVIVLVFISGCSAEDIMMDATLESINESNSNGLFPIDIEMLNSNEYKEEIETYLEKLNPEVDISKSNYAFGDLDGDSIPELVLYIERDSKNLDDEGSLIVYSLVDGQYKQLDLIPMNYDNKNYLLKLGMLSIDQPGILLSNQVGVKAAVTYGYILQNGQLKNILNPKRVNLVSFDAMEAIDDIDGDGILEFGIWTVDPETKETNIEDANKILLWYKWDGIDGAVFVRKDAMITRSLALYEASSDIDGVITYSESFIQDLEKNIDKYSESEISILLSSHITYLEMNSSYNSLDIASIFSKYTKKTSLLDLLDNYNLTNNRINDVDYLKRDKVLETEYDLKDMLISNLNKGYFLSLDNGRYIYAPDYSKFETKFSKSITKELQGYLSIMSKYTLVPHINKTELLIDKIDLAKRLYEIENYRLTYSYSDNLENINRLYKDYLTALLFYSPDGEIITDSKIVSNKEINKFIDIVNSYPETYFSQVINQLLVLLNNNQNSLNPELLKEINQMIR